MENINIVKERVRYQIALCDYTQTESCQTTQIYLKEA